MKPRICTCALVVAALVLLLACEKQSPPVAAGQVKASTAYLDNFGAPPTPKQGDCLARVGFFPLRSDPARVRAVPFFLFGETDPLQQLLDRLAGGEVPLTFDPELFNPFPAGSVVRVAAHDADSVTLDLTFAAGLPPASSLTAIAAVLTETASQFDDIERVILHYADQPLAGTPVDGLRHDPARIAPVGAPVLFMVAGAWPPGGDGPEEIVANFDRPVTIGAFRLEDAEGQPLAGDYYQSAFDMSVVLHPANPAAFRAGMPLTASWEVSDGLGRRGEGTSTLPLLRREHVEPP